MEEDSVYKLSINFNKNPQHQQKLQKTKYLKPIKVRAKSRMKTQPRINYISQKIDHPHIFNNNQLQLNDSLETSSNRLQDNEIISNQLSKEIQFETIQNFSKDSMRQQNIQQIKNYSNSIFLDDEKYIQEKKSIALKAKSMSIYDFQTEIKLKKQAQQLVLKLRKQKQKFKGNIQLLKIRQLEQKKQKQLKNSYRQFKNKEQMIISRRKKALQNIQAMKLRAKQRKNMQIKNRKHQQKKYSQQKTPKNSSSIQHRNLQKLTEEEYRKRMINLGNRYLKQHGKIARSSSQVNEYPITGSEDQRVLYEVKHKLKILRDIFAS